MIAGGNADVSLAIWYLSQTAESTIFMLVCTGVVMGFEMFSVGDWYESAKEPRCSRVSRSNHGHLRHARTATKLQIPQNIPREAAGTLVSKSRAVVAMSDSGIMRTRLERFRP